MEPKKLFSTIGIVTTTIIAIILFVAEQEKVSKFFFPEKKDISFALFFFILTGSLLLLFYVMYGLYHRMKINYLQEKGERERLQVALTDEKRLSFLDKITKIANEKKFEEDLQKRDKVLFHLILLDLDGFGRINKKFGFQRGDEIITEIAQSINLKMRRDERIYKRETKQTNGFVRRVYRKYTGGDELIFLIRGEQFESVGFTTRLQEQLGNLSKESEIINGDYDIQFHAAILPLSPVDTYEDAKSNMHRVFIHAAEELNNLRVHWDLDVEKKERQQKKDSNFIYDKAWKVFKVDEPNKQ